VVDMLDCIFRLLENSKSLMQTFRVESKGRLRLSQG
jgi:hypothetical protein